MQACLNNCFHGRTVEIVEKGTEKPTMTRKQKYILKLVRMAERCLIECGSLVGIAILCYIAIGKGLMADVIALPITAMGLVLSGYRLCLFVQSFIRLREKYERIM